MGLSLGNGVDWLQCACRRALGCGAGHRGARKRVLGWAAVVAGLPGACRPGSPAKKGRQSAVRAARLGGRPGQSSAGQPGLVGAGDCWLQGAGGGRLPVGVTAVRAPALGACPPGARKRVLGWRRGVGSGRWLIDCSSGCRRKKGAVAGDEVGFGAAVGVVSARAAGSGATGTKSNSGKRLGWIISMHRLVGKVDDEIDGVGLRHDKSVPITRERKMSFVGAGGVIYAQEKLAQARGQFDCCAGRSDLDPTGRRYRRRAAWTPAKQVCKALKLGRGCQAASFHCCGSWRAFAARMISSISWVAAT